MTDVDTLRFVVFCPAGLQVRGTHDSETPPINPQLLEAFDTDHTRWKERIRLHSGGFDGDRAVLLDYRMHAGALVLHTGYRTYSQGRALHDALLVARAAGMELDAGALLRPSSGLSWGFAVNTFVLLPHDHVLCSQRGESVLVDSGVWTPRFSEVIEPGDINWRDMSPLLRRLCDEELPALRGLAQPRYVGLGVLPLSYTWVLVSVLDLREQPLREVEQRLAELRPSHEVSNWGVCSLHQDLVNVRPYPEHLYFSEQPDEAAMDLARRLFEGHRFVQP